MDKLFIKLCQSCSRLKQVVLYNASKLTDPAVEAAIEHLPELEMLPLAGWNSLTDKALVAITKFARLRGLHLTGNRGFTNTSIANVVRNNPGISKLTLTLRDGTRYDSTVFRGIAGHCNNLRSLAIEILVSFDTSEPPEPTTLLPTDEDLIPLIHSCPLLTSFTINGPTKCTAQLFYKLSSHCPNLTSISLHGNPYADPGTALITDEAVSALTSACPLLSSITLNACMELTDQGIISIAQCCKSLTCIVLGCNSNITDTAMRLLFESCTLLSTVAVNQLKKLTDNGMLALPLHCHKLSVLYLYDIRVTDAFLNALAQHCPKLTQLTLYGYTFTNNAYHTLKTLLQQCISLTYIKLEACPGFTNHTLINLLTRHAKQLKQLSVIDCLHVQPDRSLHAFIATIPASLRLTIGISEETMFSMLFMTAITTQQEHHHDHEEEQEEEVEDEEEVVEGGDGLGEPEPVD